MSSTDLVMKKFEFWNLNVEYFLSSYNCSNFWPARPPQWQTHPLPSATCHLCRYCILFLKIQARQRYCWSYLSWWPCYTGMSILNYFHHDEFVRASIKNLFMKKSYQIFCIQVLLWPNHRMKCQGHLSPPSFRHSGAPGISNALTLIFAEVGRIDSISRQFNTKEMQPTNPISLLIAI